MTLCKYCSCDPETDTLPEAVTKLRGCNNCRVDIIAMGEWTGNGIQAIRRLVEKHGYEAVDKEWEAQQ